jgi:hypothetical protein
MTAPTMKDPQPIRLVFELARADHPRLYDDLIQFHQGTKRVNRLRLLAYDGLLVQSGLFVWMGRGLPNQILECAAQEGGGDVTNDLFAPSIQE